MKLKRDLVGSDTSEESHELKRMKIWKNAISGHKCFMMYARSLNINWGDHDYWIWNCLGETGHKKTEVAKLRAVCWLDVRGVINISDLSPGTVYEVAYVVSLTKAASGWELPIKLRLDLPGGKVQERQVSLLQKPREQWMELSLGHFCTEENGVKTEETGQVWFNLYEHGGHWKNGLVIKGAVLRPIN